MHGKTIQTNGQTKQHFSCIYAQATYETVLITTSNIANPTPTPRPKSTPRKIVAKHTTIHINYTLRKKSLLNVNMWINTTIVCTSNVAYLIVYITCLEKQRSLKFTEMIKRTLLHHLCRFIATVPFLIDLISRDFSRGGQKDHFAPLKPFSSLSNASMMNLHFISNCTQQAVESVEVLPPLFLKISIPA